MNTFDKWIQEWQERLTTLQALRQMYQELPVQDQAQVREAIRQYQQQG